MTSSPDRYLRQSILPGIGTRGQARIADATVAIVGCGALGCGVIDLLARAGVGRLVIIDRDVVEWSNLQRQSLYDERDAREGAAKVEAAERRARAVNSTVNVVAHAADVNGSSAERLLLEHAPSVIIDGTDNFQTRYLLNDVSVKHAIPLVYGGVLGSRGMQATFLPGGACLRCVFDDAPPAGSQPTCDTAGVLNAAAAIVSACQAADTIKLLVGETASVGASLLEFELWSAHRRRIDISAARRTDCRACGARDFQYLAARPDDTSLCGQDAVQVHPSTAAAVDLESIASRLAPVGNVTAAKFLVRVTLAEERGDEGGRIELTVFRDGRAIVRGTRRPERARSLYARYVGA